MISLREILLALIVTGLAAHPAWSQNVTHPTKGRLCVARIANSSGKPVAVDRVQDELIAQLQRHKVDAVAAPTLTMLANNLELTSSNQGAMRAMKCDSILLAEVGQGKAAGITLEFSVFSRARELLLHATSEGSGGDASQAALAAVPAVAKKAADTVSSGK